MSGCAGGLTALFLFAFVCPAVAETFTWKGGTGKMTDATKWENGVSPVFTNDLGKTSDVVLPATASVLDRPIVTMADAKIDNPSKTKYYFKSVKGDRQYTLYLPHWDYSYQFGHTLEIEDPSEFHGTISAYHTKSHRGPYSPILRATSSDPAKRIFRRVIADGRLVFAAANDTVLKVEQPIGTGFIEAGTSADGGTVELLSSPGGLTHVKVVNGTLRLHGNTASNEGPVDGAWAHFDASRTNTLTVSNGRVTAWRDVSGAGPTATRHGNSKDDPALAADAASGLNVVDFGAFGGSLTSANELLPDDTPDFAVYGKPCALTLPEEAAVKEMFVVYREHTRIRTAPLWVGVDYSYSRAAEVALIRSRDASHPGQLFSADSQTTPLNWAEIRFDGQRVSPTYRPDATDRLHVLSVGFDGGSTKVKNLAFGRNTGAWISLGGLQMAEILMYTNALTSAQRRQVNGYLKRKWLPKEDSDDWDLGRVEMNGDKCRIEVADGVAAIRELKLPASAKTIAKGGAGDLVIDRVFCGDVLTNLPVRAESGNVWFANHQGNIACTAAANPDVWLDASDMGESSFLSSNNVEYVTQWTDRRTGGRNNRGERVTADRYVYGGRVQAYATRRTVTINGVEKSIVDFGEASTNSIEKNTAFWTENGQDSAAYRINYNGAIPSDANSCARVREAFMVVRRKSSLVTPWGQGRTDLYDFYSGSTWRFYTRGFCNHAAEGAIYEVNGRVVAGEDDNNGMNTTDFFVISFAAGEDASVTGLACNRGQYNFGGLQIAEVLLYDRPLSVSEHRNTTAYLMRKWLGKDHPEQVSRGAVPTVDLVGGQDVVVGSDDDLTIGQVVGGGGTFVKKGDGKVTMTMPISSASFSSIDVAGGELVVSTDILGGAYFRLDTTDWERTMTITNGGDATQWVTEWRDPRNNGKAAYAYVGKPIRPGVSPQLVDMTAGGRAVKALTCGPLLSRGESTTNSLGYFQESKGAQTAAMDWFTTSAERKTPFAEHYAIHARRTATENLSLFGLAEYDPNSWRTNVNDKTYTSCYPYRCGQNTVAKNDFGAAVYYGELYVNNDDTNVTGAYAQHTVGNFRLFCAVPLAPVWIGAFGRRELYDVGGSYWLETAVFTQTNSVAARQKIRDYLYGKWFSDQTMKTSFESLRVRNGGRLDLKIADKTQGYAVSALAGCGTIETDHPVSGVSSLSLEGVLSVTDDVSLSLDNFTVNFRSATEYDRLVVGGTLTLPSACTITVSSDVERLPLGEYPILTAENLVGGIANWTVDASSLKKDHVSLRKVGSSVCLAFTQGGTMVLFR